jgi:hypothetical protein
MPTLADLTVFHQFIRIRLEILGWIQIRKKLMRILNTALT